VLLNLIRVDPAMSRAPEKFAHVISYKLRRVKAMTKETALRHRCQSRCRLALRLGRS
jgi:hypothetical protein